MFTLTLTVEAARALPGTSWLVVPGPSGLGGTIDPGPFHAPFVQRTHQVNPRPCKEDDR